MDAPKYRSGDDIRIGDLIEYGGQPGEVVFVLDTNSFLPAFLQGDWSYLGQGFMLQVNGYGLVHLREAEEDLRLVERASNT